MRIKIVIVNYFLAVAVLFSILFQSVHSYSHFEKQLLEKKCTHKHNSSQEITHQHHNFDHCLVCGFTFSNVLNTVFFNFTFYKNILPLYYSFTYSTEIISYFKGSLFALRAPPTI